ncbi:hypothetical protein PQX77_005679 [Marasmius sp. AFHP31]|nr:hypothetical protein PQX77_005679 [Marasmius sp. AFHP31]
MLLAAVLGELFAYGFRGENSPRGSFMEDLVEGRWLKPINVNNTWSVCQKRLCLQLADAARFEESTPMEAKMEDCRKVRYNVFARPLHLRGCLEEDFAYACESFVSILVLLGLQCLRDSPFPCPDTLKDCKADDSEPIVIGITAHIDGTTAQLKAYANAKVNLIALAAIANIADKASVAVFIDAPVRLLVSLVASIVVCIKTALSVIAQAESNASIKIFALFCISLCAFLQVCCQLSVRLTVSLADKLTVFVGF